MGDSRTPALAIRKIKSSMNLLTQFAPLLLQGLIGAFIVFVFLWALQWIRRDSGWVDVGWTAGVGILGAAAVFQTQGWQPRACLVGTLILIWSIRLVAYIIKDRLCSGEEDSRYQTLRTYFGKKAQLGFFFFFTSQSLLVVLFAIPLLPAINHPTPHWTLFDGLGTLLWLASMGGEWLADWQLTRFRRNPTNRGKVCRQGLWSRSRHPNYFFEWLQWVAYCLIAYNAPAAFLSLLGPIAIYLFLMKLTGIPHVEREALRKRGEAYAAYQREVPIFFPRLFPIPKT